MAYIDVEIDLDIGYLKSLGIMIRPIVNQEITTTMKASLDTVEAFVVDNAPVVFGHYRNSIKQEITGRPFKMEGEVFTAIIYGYPLEVGRRAPGPMPPVHRIRAWVIRKGIAPVGEANEVAWRIAYHIALFGTRRQLIFRRSWDKARPMVVRLWDELPSRVVKKAGALI